MLNFLALPEDSLSLANALRSPLFSWSEQELFTLAHYREEKHLWQGLRNSTARPETLDILNDLRSQADFLRPFELIDRLLTRHNGRQNLIARLGNEASDGIDAVLSQAINYEQSNVPSLTGFLCWLDTFSAEVKRQIDSQGDQIRIMTVHGAKGLEAPIVILPDTATRPNPLRDLIVSVGSSKIWKPPSNEVPNSVSQSLDVLKEKQLDERLRLLYVAMTRAENWLIVAAAGKVGSNDESWHSIVSSGLKHAGASSTVVNGQDVLRFEHGDWNQGAVVKSDGRLEGPHTPITLGPIQTKSKTRALTPSDLGGAKVILGPHSSNEPEDGLAKGRLIHALLEHLPNHPANQHAIVGRRIIDRHEDKEHGDDTLIENVSELISNDELSWIFASDALAEVEICASIESLGDVNMSGIIDRLIITEDTVTLVDFKTNEIAPKNAEETPEGILRQLGLYACALRKVYPDREIKTAILWTGKKKLIYLPTKLVSDALARVNSP